MSALSKSFSAIGVSGALRIAKGSTLEYAITGTFVATLALKKTSNGGASASTVSTFTTTGSGTVEAPEDASYYFECTAYTSGTPAITLTPRANVLNEYKNQLGQSVMRITDVGIDALSIINRASQNKLIPAAMGKAGATAGWLNAATDNISLATLPASKTASTLVIPIPDLKVGQTILGFSLIGQIESVGATATLDCALRKMTSAAADVADALVAAMTQLSVIAETAVGSANAAKTGLTETIVDGASYYLLVTGTTAALTDIALQGAVIQVNDTSSVAAAVLTANAVAYTAAAAVGVDA